MPQVQVEFFGMARKRAQVERQALSAATLREALQRLGQQFPDLEGYCFHDGELAAGWLVNLDGRQFVRDGDIPLSDGTTLLLLAADVGG